MFTRQLVSSLRTTSSTSSPLLPRLSAATLPRASPLSARSLSSTIRRLADAQSGGASSPPPAAGAEGAEAPAAKSGELAEAEKKITEALAKVKELEKDILYGKAEIQTLNRRVTDERNKASEFAITSFARSLIGTTDILTAALKHVPQPIPTGESAAAALADLFNGVELTQKALLKTFGEHGVRKMDVGRGTTFDPNLHEATFQIPKEVAGPKGNGEWSDKGGEVVEVVKEGWVIKDRVLKAAQVGITQMS